MRCLLLALLPAALLGTNPDLMKVKSVYILPMSNGMDQYLANRIQESNLYIVTSDPQTADALFTDGLGPPFEKKMAELYPVEVEKEEGEEPVYKEQERITSFRKGKGTFFLVERSTKRVVWSTYARPKNFSADQMDRAAKDITMRLKKTLDPKVPNR